MSDFNLPLIQRYRWAIISFSFLSLVDLTLTKFSLDYLGAIEANPLMSLLFSWNFLSAFVFKGFVVLLISLIAYHLWSRNDVRLILATGNLLMLTIVAYEMAGIALTL